DEAEPLALGHFDECVPDLPEERLASQAPDPRKDAEDDVQWVSCIDWSTAMVSDAIPAGPTRARPRAAASAGREGELSCHAGSVEVGSDNASAGRALGAPMSAQFFAGPDASSAGSRMLRGARLIETGRLRIAANIAETHDRTVELGRLQIARAQPVADACAAASPSTSSCSPAARGTTRCLPPAVLPSSAPAAGDRASPCADPISPAAAARTTPARASAPRSLPPAASCAPAVKVPVRSGGFGETAANTPPRSDALTWYIASSARRIRFSGSRASSGKAATPRLAVSLIGPYGLSARKGWRAICPPMRRAAATAWSLLVSGITIMNSSPP